MCVLYLRYVMLLTVGPGGEMQGSMNSGNNSSSSIVNTNSHSHDSNDMDIEMEDVDKNDMGWVPWDSGKI